MSVVKEDFLLILKSPLFEGVGRKRKQKKTTSHLFVLFYLSNPTSIIFQQSITTCSAANDPDVELDPPANLNSKQLDFLSLYVLPLE